VEFSFAQIVGNLIDKLTAQSRNATAACSRWRRRVKSRHFL